jgi:hypothetical protein
VAPDPPLPTGTGGLRAGPPLDGATLMSPGGPQPFIHQAGRPSFSLQKSLTLSTCELLGSTPVPLKFVSLSLAPRGRGSSGLR